MGKLFGTDGIRGVVGTELSCELAMKVGKAAAYVLAKHGKSKPNIIIGRDTRISGQMLEAALVAGICSVGADCLLAEVVPTPAISLLTKKYKCDAGIMISASHNPAEFNGIKIFNGEGLKLSDELELEIEEFIFNFDDKIIFDNNKEIGRSFFCKNAVADYVDYVCKTIECSDLSGIKVIVDCANGSASTTAASIFKKLRVNADFINDAPDGFNINENCGSTHIDRLASYVRKGNYDVGVAFDGDADRCLAVDEDGNIIDGDQLIAIFAKHMKNNKCLAGDTVVVTVMSNLGFFHFAKENNINLEVTKVGDRYVLEKMLTNGHKIGGEQSGHIIFKDFANTGDGQLTAVQLLNCIKNSGKSFSELASVMSKFPQVLVNVKANSEQKEIYLNSSEIEEYIQKKKQLLGEDGRILVRCSGTEPIIRVMIEGKNKNLIKEMSNEIAEKIVEVVCA